MISVEKFKHKVWKIKWINLPEGRTKTIDEKQKGKIK